MTSYNRIDGMMEEHVIQVDLDDLYDDMNTSKSLDPSELNNRLKEKHRLRRRQMIQRKRRQKDLPYYCSPGAREMFREDPVQNRIIKRKERYRVRQELHNITLEDIQSQNLIDVIVDDIVDENE